MHGQKPLWSPGAWQAYFPAACLLARCPQEHISRPAFGESLERGVIDFSSIIL